MIAVILLLILAPVLVISFLYRLSSLRNRVTKRYPLNKVQSQLILVSLILASLIFPFIPSYRSHDIVQRGLLPFGVLSDLFSVFIIIWYVSILSLGLWRFMTEYYPLLKTKH